MYWYYQFRRWNNMGECPVLFVENVQCLFRAKGNVGVGHVFAAVLERDLDTEPERWTS
jgi:hypothetical protein